MGLCASKRDQEIDVFLRTIEALRQDATADATRDQLNAAYNQFAELVAKTDQLKRKIVTSSKWNSADADRWRIRCAQLHCIQCRLHARGVCDEPESMDQRIEMQVENLETLKFLWRSRHWK